MAENEINDLKEIIEVASHISAGLEIENIIQNVVFYLISKFNPETISFLLPTDIDDLRPHIHYFTGTQKIKKKLKFSSIASILGYFNDVEFNQVPFRNFAKFFPDRDIIRELKTLKPNSLIALRSDKGIVGIFMLGSKKDKTPYSTNEIHQLTYIIRFTSIAIENANLFRQATIDRMTKLYTHHSFQKRLEEEITRCHRYNSFFSIIFFDIDHFKTLNDTYGHLKGDEIIKKVAQITQASIRNIDYPSRYGGEEFAIILPEIDAEGAYRVAERLRKIIDRYEFKAHEKNILKITISLGVAQFKKEFVQYNSQIIDCADRALYRSKNEGRNKVSVGKFERKEFKAS